jgi:acyl-coenzyme A thioesterase PaaI-like protein
MDEIASWYVFTQLRTAGVTSRIEVRYLKPVYTNKGMIKLQATLKEQKKRLRDIEVKVFNEEGELCTEGVVQYFVFPEEYARKHLYYPDFDSFFTQPD